jgi:hypothetical protein
MYGFYRSLRAAAASRPGRLLAVGAALPALLLAVTACGGSSGASAATSPSSGSSGGASAYLNCLREHGVTQGGFGSGSGSTPSSTVTKARQACASLRPADGFGGSGTFSAAFQKFESCLSAHGVKIPSGSSGFRSIFSELQSGNATVQAAVSACRSDLPFPSGGGSGGGFGGGGSGGGFGGGGFGGGGSGGGSGSGSGSTT